MSRRESRSELHELLADLLESNLSEARWGVLKELLNSSEHARRLYRQTMIVESILERFHVDGDIQSADPSYADIPLALAPQPRRAVQVLLQAPKFVARPMRVPLTMAALVLVSIIATMSFLGTPSFLDTPISRPVAGLDENDGLQSGHFVAQLTDVYEAVWAEGQAVTRSGSHLRSGYQMELRDGFAEVTFNSGAKVLLEGPVTFEVRTEDAGVLSLGKLTGHVGTPETGGLRIETPYADVVDLGTRFGISVDEQTVDVVVFQGMVEVALRREGVLAGTDRKLGVDESLRIQEGKAIRTDAQAIASKFARNIRDVGPVLLAVRANSGCEYRIAPTPLQEDAVSHSDRPYQWNGVTGQGLPEYLIGAEYVQTAMDDKFNRSLKVQVVVRRAATMYLFVSDRRPAPDWVREDFRRNGDKVGSDTDRGNRSLHIGPGEGIDLTCDVWQRAVSPGEVIELGRSQDGHDENIGTYGVAVVPIE